MASHEDEQVPRRTRRRDERGPARIVYPSMRRRRVAVTYIALAIFGLLAFALHNADSHHLNLRYLAWKVRLVEYDSRSMGRYLLVDVRQQRRFVGKTPREIQGWFSNVRFESPAAEQGIEGRGPRGTDGTLVAPFTGWSFTVTDGRVASVHYAKG